MGDVMNKSKLSLPVTFEKISEYTSESSDERITKVRVTLMHLGLNYNGSIFNKDVVDTAIPTLAYCPIVGFVEKNEITGEKDFSDHRYIIVKDDKGVRRKYMGSAYGVILSAEENNAHYEDKLCDDGETRTFLVVDGIMWNMFDDSTEIINRDVIKSESMELAQDNEDSYEGFEDDDGNFVFTKFSFRAACILGCDAQPAMEGANVEVVNFTMSDFVKDIQSELNNKYTTFTKMLEEKSTKRGGSKIMAKTDFSTIMALFNDVAAIVENYETVKNCWNEDVPRYCLADIQDNEAIIVDRKDNWNYYGVTFTIEGDKPVIDFSTAQRKKVVFEDYVDGSTKVESAFEFGKYISEIENTAQAKVSEFETKLTEMETAKSELEIEKNEAVSAKDTAEANYAAIKAELDEMKPKYEDYVAAEQKRADDELNAKRDEMLAQFECALSDNAEYNEIKDNKSDYSVDEIEAKCSILLFRKNKAVNFNKSTKNAVIGVPIVDSDTNDGYVATKYGNIPIAKN